MRSPLYFLIAGVAAAGSALAEPEVTFNRDVAPIIYHNCASCHRPGEAAPFPLLSYQDTAKKGKQIAKVTSSRFMPPWKPETASFPYRDERRLADNEIALIQDWVSQGMPEGRAADRQPPPTFASGWQLGGPDLVVQ